MNNNFSDEKDIGKEKKIAVNRANSKNSKEITGDEANSDDSKEINANEIARNKSDSGDSNQNDASEKEPLDESEQSEYKNQIHTLEARDLHKYFGRKKAVQGVNFKIHSGEVVRTGPEKQRAFTWSSVFTSRLPARFFLTAKT